MILKRKDSKGKTRYGVRVDRDKQQVWVGTYETLAEARTAEHRARTGPMESKMLCREYVEHWLEGYATRNKASSYSTAECALRGFVADWGHVPLPRVTRIEAEKWARKNRWRVPTVVALFNSAFDAELVNRNPFKGLATKSKGRRRQKPLSVEEVERLARLAQPHGFRPFVLFAAYSALRVGELYGLKWSDIDFERNRIHVRRRVYRGAIDLPKSNKVRLVALTPPAREAIADLDRTTEWVFPNKRGGRMDQDALYTHWRKFTKGFGRKVDPHELKHFAGYYLYVICDLHERIVAEQLGHNDGGKLVRELYGHGDEGALAAIDAAFADNVVPLRQAQ